jgi:hypothetical protein
MPWGHIREWRYSSTILDFGTRWRWVVSFTPRPLYPRYSLDPALDKNLREFSGNDLDLYSGCARFEFRPGHWLSWDFPCSSPVLPDKCSVVSYLGHNNFLPNPFEFIIYHSPYHSTLHSPNYWHCLKINHKKMSLMTTFHKVETCRT